MKTKLRIWWVQLFSARSALWSLFLAALCLVPGSVRADGCFVMPPFVWDKHKDINEPTQKAIIVHNGRQEDLILQVKYAGPVNDFGWLIPTPALPTVRQASMDCFYELSRYTQQLWERGDYLVHNAGSLGAAEKAAAPEPVKVIEMKTVGAYQIAVLSAQTAGSLQVWLNTNHFAFPPNKTEVIDSYVKRQWYFVAVKIHLADGEAGMSGSPKPGATSTSVRSTRQKLTQGELHPLHLRFEAPQCVFPLKISSFNGRPSEVQIYVLSTERLLEKRLWEKQRAHSRQRQEKTRAQTASEWRPYLSRTYSGELFSSQAQPELEGRLEAVGYPYTEPLRYAQVTGKELPRCAKELPCFKAGTWWLSKDTWTFKPEEMQDLVFEPAIPMLQEKLSSEVGYDAACALLQCGLAAEGALLTALESPNTDARVAAAASIVQTSGDLNLLRAAADRLTDPRPEVRLLAEHAVFRLGAYGEDIARHIPKLLRMLAEEPPATRVAALEILMDLGTAVPREEAASFFKIPDSRAVFLAYTYLRTRDLTCDEAAPLLSNKLAYARSLGLQFLKQARSARSVELALPLLGDRDENVRATAHRVLQSLTAQSFALNHPEQWEQWWAANKQNFKPSEDR